MKTIDVSNVGKYYSYAYFLGKTNLELARGQIERQIENQRKFVRRMLCK